MRDNIFYAFLKEGLGAGITFDVWINTFFAEKYNHMALPAGFVWGENQNTFEYKQMEGEAKIYALPSIVDYNSPGKTHGFERVEMKSGEIPRMKHQYHITEKTVREKFMTMVELGRISDSDKAAISTLLFNSYDNLIGGNFNMLELMRNQLVSTGKFIVNNTNNPEGIKSLEFDFMVPDAQRLKAAGHAWTDASADPIKDLMTAHQYAIDNGIEYGHFEMSQALWNKFRMHPNVIEKLVISQNPLVDAANVGKILLQEDQVKQAVVGLGLPRIEVIDSVVHVDGFDKKTGKRKSTIIKTFDENMVSLIPDGNIGEVKTVKPLYLTEMVTPVNYFADGRMSLRQVANIETNSQYIESEFTALTVPDKAMNFIILDTSKVA